MSPLIVQLLVDAWTSISALVPVKHLLNLLSKPSIFSLALAGFSLAPGVQAAFRDSENLAQTGRGSNLTDACSW